MKEPSERIMSEKKDPNQIINRHKARILSNLEDAGCPVVFRDAVVSGLNWLRSDINENERNGDTTHEQEETSGNI